MNHATLQLLDRVTKMTGDGSAAQGFDLFGSEYLPLAIRRRVSVPTEDLRDFYEYAAAVRYVAKLCPDDAPAIRELTGVEL